MKLRFLGTGTSHGIPQLGCRCEVCTSTEEKDKRSRSSVWIWDENTSILIDTATEFRLQALEAGISRVDGVLYTHCHADHVFGFDDLRSFSQLQQKPVPVYGNKQAIQEMKEVFAYVFRKTPLYATKPEVALHQAEESFFLGSFFITPIPLFHGTLPILGYRVQDVAYLTDCSHIPEASYSLLSNLEVLILGVLRQKPHATHLHLDKALDLVAKLNPKRTYFTHISHDMGLSSSLALPPLVCLAHDGLEITAGDSI